VTAQVIGGVVAAFTVLLVAWLGIALMFSWDDPDKPRREQNREAMRELKEGLFDERRSGGSGVRGDREL
jgi:hypothetical protein